MGVFLNLYKRVNSWSDGPRSKKFCSGAKIDQELAAFCKHVIKTVINLLCLRSIIIKTVWSVTKRDENAATRLLNYFPTPVQFSLRKAVRQQCDNQSTTVLLASFKRIQIYTWVKRSAGRFVSVCVESGSSAATVLHVVLQGYKSADACENSTRTVRIFEENTRRYTAWNLDICTFLKGF